MNHPDMQLEVTMERTVNLVPYANNAKVHTNEQIEQICESIEEFGFADPVGVWTNADGGSEIVEGHGRVLAAQKLGIEEVPVIHLDALTDEQRRAYMLVHNQLTMNTGWDFEALDIELEDLSESFDLGDFGFSDWFEQDDGRANDDANPSLDDANPSLAERFLIPPFSIFDARKRDWQDRKRAWRSLGIKSEIGRDNGLVYRKGLSLLQAQYKNNAVKENEDGDIETSIFDPVLCEILYLWFSIDGDAVLDPFAGGSVRGIVAERLGRSYTGVELRPEQVEANREQADHICSNKPTWIVGDSSHIDELAKGEYDFLFTCPPYAQLEVYSDNPADLSNMEFEAFSDALRNILGKSVGMLKQDRFAAVVIGNVRDNCGFMQDLNGLVISAMEDAGARYYNGAVLITPCGSAPIRASSQFTASRKLVNTHQNVLIFCKGDAKAATKRFGPIDIIDIAAIESAL